MSRRIRTHDWAGSALGPPERWPQSLRTAVDLMVASGHAMQLAWGPQRIVLYNDAYAPMLGDRHPDVLGLPFHEAWPEIWDEIRPLVDRVFAGETVRFTDMPLVMTRHGYSEDTWWNFSYSPIWEEGDGVAGLLNVTVDVSAKHRADAAERERDVANARLQENERRFRALATAGGNSIYRMSPDWQTMYQLDSQTLASATAPIEHWIERYIPPDDLPAVQAALDRAIQTKTLYEYEHRVQLADGTIGWVLSRAVPLLGPEGEIIEWFGTAKDVTAQHQVTQRLFESDERHAFLLQLSDAIRPLNDAAAIQATASRSLARQLHANRAMYCEFEGQGATRQALIHGMHAVDGLPFPSSVRYSDFVSPEVGQVLQAGGTLVIDDTAGESRLDAEMRARWLAHGIAAMIIVGLVKEGIETAHFSLQSRVPRRWAATEVELVREVAERTWAANERARAEAALKKSSLDLKAALADNERARSALQRGDIAKDRFLAVLSHELRNPLASVNAAAKVLASEALDTASRDRAVAIITRQTRGMKVLLDDLLDISRLRLGKLTLKRQTVALDVIVDAAIEATRGLLDAQSHVLTTDLQARDTLLDGDPVRLSQVVANLLSNAAKYTPPGGRITLSTREQGSKALIEVSDNGIGLEPSQIELMFEMFTQGAQPSGHGGQSGLGIGLALARNIVALHDGSVDGSSAGPGRGSRFVITLPRVPTLPGDVPDDTGDAHAERAERTKPRILLVDDNADVIWAISMLLGDCETERAHTAAEGLRIAKARLPDVAVLDLGLPDMSGLDLARAIRGLPGADRILLVAATGWGREDDRQQALAAGFNAHLVKPINIETLQGLIQSHGHERC